MIFGRCSLLVGWLAGRFAGVGGRSVVDLCSVEICFAWQAIPASRGSPASPGAQRPAIHLMWAYIGTLSVPMSTQATRPTAPHAQPPHLHHNSDHTAPCGCAPGAARP